MVNLCGVTSSRPLGVLQDAGPHWWQSSWMESILPGSPVWMEEDVVCPYDCRNPTWWSQWGRRLHGHGRAALCVVVMVLRVASCDEGRCTNVAFKVVWSDVVYMWSILRVPCEDDICLVWSSGAVWWWWSSVFVSFWWCEDVLMWPSWWCMKWCGPHVKYGMVWSSSTDVTGLWSDGVCSDLVWCSRWLRRLCDGTTW